MIDSDSKQTEQDVFVQHCCLNGSTVKLSYFKNKGYSQGQLTMVPFERIPLEEYACHIKSLSLTCMVQKL